MIPLLDPERVNLCLSTSDTSFIVQYILSSSITSERRGSFFLSLLEVQLAHWSKFQLYRRCFRTRQWLLIASVYKAEHSPINQRLLLDLSHACATFIVAIYSWYRGADTNVRRLIRRGTRRARDSREITLSSRSLSPFIVFLQRNATLPRFPLQVYKLITPRYDTFQIHREKSADIYIRFDRNTLYALFSTRDSTLTSATTGPQCAPYQEVSCVSLQNGCHMLFYGFL